MSNHVYKIIDVVGSAPGSTPAAIKQAIATCDKTLEHLEWFEVKEVRGSIKDGGVGNYQVVLKIGFRLNG